MIYFIQAGDNAVKIGWSQEKLAVECDVSKQTIESWETGGNIHVKHDIRLRQIFRTEGKVKA